MGEHTGQLHIALDNYQLYLKRRMKIEAAVKQASLSIIFGWHVSRRICNFVYYCDP